MSAQSAQNASYNGRSASRPELHRGKTGKAGQDMPAAKPYSALPNTSIGEVWKQLRADFPDVSVSKIRYLETEGLITPRRSESGYRKYSKEDIARLRYILSRQRDKYLPLKVIKEELEALDSGKVTAFDAKRFINGAVSAEQMRAADSGRLTRSDVCVQSGVSDSSVGQMIRLGLISPDVSGYYTQDDVAIVQLANKLLEYGLDGRHLKQLLTIANRHYDIVARIAEPLSHARSEHAREHARETAREVSALIISLNTALVKANLT